MKEHELRSTGPEIKMKTFTYTNDEPFTPPAPGEFMVTVIKDRQPGTVYQVSSCRQVKSVKYPYRYSIEAIVRKKENYEITITFRFDVFVDGKPAHPIFWQKREKKK